jgi:hypothetical protein
MATTYPDRTSAGSRSWFNVGIANGASLSDPIDLTGLVLVGLQMPAAWTAAAITFQASADGVTYADVYSAGAELSVTVSASQCVRLDSTIMLSFRYWKIRSGTSGTPVNQGAARTIMAVAAGPI